MGHLYRSIDLANAFSKRGISSVFLTNSNYECFEVLKSKNFVFHHIDDIGYGVDKYFKNIEYILNRYNPNFWVNDRLDTDFHEVMKIKQRECKIITFDDRGSGATVADINFCPLIFDKNEIPSLAGNKILYGLKYLALDGDISKYYRRRSRLENILVTFGGSDTHNITESCLNLLNSLDFDITIVLGPSSQFNEYNLNLENHIEIKRNVPCLYSEMYKSDLAITSCGMTPFQCNATGLPCVCIAAEKFEIQVGKFLRKNNGNIFLGHFSQVDWERDFVYPKDISRASDECYNNMTLNGIENVVNEVLSLF